MTLNPWQRKAREQYPHGANYMVQALGEGAPFHSLPVILDRLAYEQRECRTCRGKGEGRWPDELSVHDCPDCHGTGHSPDYRKAQEWAKRLGLEDG